jgi:hypothetical protein
MDFLLKINSLLNKRECINKNVYNDIENFIDFKKGLIDNYDSVIFGIKYEIFEVEIRVLLLLEILEQTLRLSSFLNAIFSSLHVGGELEQSEQPPDASGTDLFSSSS